MEDPFELKALRDLREIDLAIRDIQSQQALVAKRFKEGIKLLQKEAYTVEAQLADQSESIKGAEAWNTRSPILRTLINDPRLENIPEDNLV
jgi:hypothetical protein